MRWNEEAVLRAVALESDGEGNQTESVEETGVFCNRYAYGASSYLAAREAGLHADARIQVRTADYAGQAECELRGEIYQIEDVEEKGDLTLLSLAARKER